MAAVREQGQLIVLDGNEAHRSLGSPLVTRLSLVVHLADRWSPEGGTLGTRRVRLDPSHRSPIVNLSGDVCFLDLPLAVYTLSIVSAYYFRDSVSIDLAQLDPASPVQEVILRPTPAYPFPPGATLLRGSVQDNHGAPVAEATVTVLEAGPRTQTTECGEFALAWLALSDDQVYREARASTGVMQRFVKGDSGGKEIRIVVTHPEVQTAQHTIKEIVEGTTVSTGVIAVTRPTVVEATAAARRSRVLRTRRTRPRES